MKATTLTPAEVFGNQIRYVVPLYQRPYVWSRGAQWQPLWEDVSALADRVLDAPVVYGAAHVPPHFLGAIVIDHLPGPVTHIGARSVIDGQQRLTTLQMLLDAAQAVVAKHGRPIDASALRIIVENNIELAVNPDHVFKVWPTDRDQAAYRAAMRDDLEPNGELAKAAIARGHAYFEEAVLGWAHVDEAPAEAGERLAALTNALREKLKLVVIDLEPGDNAQVIFETLNHRGAPLLAADLVKNLLFQVAKAQDLDVDTLYAKYWRDLDGDYWRQLVARGRRFNPRIDVFMQRWLVMNLRKDVPTDRVFTEFRDSILGKPDVDVAALFGQIAADAAVHRSWETLPESSVAGRFHYRVLQALDTQVVAPVFLWLTRHGPDVMPAEQQDRALRAIESWLVRRALIRATSKDYNNAVIDLLRALDRGGPGSAGDSTEKLLSAQSAESRYWPADGRVAAALAEERVYKAMTRPRLRMVLEALEDDLRGPLGEGQSAPRGLTIEHVMPVAWREHWGADTTDLAAGFRRDDRVQALGNLTLVNGRLNPTLSNRPWTGGETAGRGLGAKGKRDFLLHHSELKLNAALVYDHPTKWTEELIRARTTALTSRLLMVWPCPADATQPDVASRGADPESVDTTDADQAVSAWSAGEHEVQLAARLWVALSPTVRRLMQILIDVAPQHVAAPDLARQLNVQTGVVGVTGHLSRPTKIAAQLGRELPVSWAEGEPSSYWIEERVADIFEAAIPLATSEPFATTYVDDEPAVHRSGSSAPSGGGRRSVPRHILEVFASRPDDVELTVRQIAGAESTAYAADEISQGAITAALKRRGVEGIEVVPGSSPVKARRKRV